MTGDKGSPLERLKSEGKDIFLSSWERALVASCLMRTQGAGTAGQTACRRKEKCT